MMYSSVACMLKAIILCETQHNKKVRRFMREHNLAGADQVADSQSDRTVPEIGLGSHLVCASDQLSS